MEVSDGDCSTDSAAPEAQVLAPGGRLGGSCVRPPPVEVRFDPDPQQKIKPGKYRLPQGGDIAQFEDMAGRGCVPIPVECVLLLYLLLS